MSLSIDWLKGRGNSFLALVDGSKCGRHRLGSVRHADSQVPRALPQTHRISNSGGGAQKCGSYGPQVMFTLANVGEPPCLETSDSRFGAFTPGAWSPVKTFSDEFLSWASVPRPQMKPASSKKQCDLTGLWERSRQICVNQRPLCIGKPHHRQPQTGTPFSTRREGCSNQKPDSL